jgi:D-alanine-D-alanine ligase
MTKRRVVVLMGGMSSEHEVSVASGTKVTESLDRNRYDVTPVLITKDGMWSFPDDAPVDLCDALTELKRLGVDCAFIALHGAFGEDGRIQGMLDMLGVPYTSSGCAASGLAIDKLRSKAIVAAAGEAAIEAPQLLSFAAGFALRKNHPLLGYTLMATSTVHHFQFLTPWRSSLV